MLPKQFFRSDGTTLPYLSSTRADTWLPQPASSCHKKGNLPFDNNKLLRMGFFRKEKDANPVAQAATEAAVLRTTAVDPPAVSAPRPRTPQYVELGTINYVNLTPDGRHGDYQTALDQARSTGKPILANFVEWSG